MAAPFIGELRIVPWTFAAKGWALCNGQVLPISANRTLFDLLGTTYGGDGITTFGLPDLRGRAPLHVGSPPGRGPYVPGQVGGEVSHTLLTNEIPQHSHRGMGNGTAPATGNSNTAASSSALGQSIGTPATGSPFTVAMYGLGTPSGAALAQQTIGNTGGSQPHDNMQPYLALNFMIALTGIFPGTPDDSN